MSVLSLFDLSGRTALVTGCRRGIGKAIAVALAQAGADIIGTSAQLEPGSEVESEVRATGRNFHAQRCDFADRNDLYRTINDLPQPIDILVNNAGTILRRPAAEHPDEYWDRVLEVNATAGFILSRELGRQMDERRSGKIIFVASLLAYQGGINVPGYAASKGAVAQLVKAFANEWAGSGVNAADARYTAAPAKSCGLPQRPAGMRLRIAALRWGSSTGSLPGTWTRTTRRPCATSDYVHGTLLTVDGGWMGR